MNRWQWRNRDICEQVTGKEQGDLEQVAREEQEELYTGDREGAGRS